MPRSPEARQRRVRKLNARIASDANDHMARCTIADPVTGRPCGRPTSRASKDGLAAFVCRYHVQHRARHGSYWAKSPSATTLSPYLKAALSYIELHRHHDVFIRAALDGLAQLMASAGPVEIATRLRGLPPDQRARIALARLREAAIKPERLLAIVIAVAALIEEAPAAVHRTAEWRTVAVAKAAHRLASGTHRRWPLPQPDGSTKHIEMHAYPRSSGRVLRVLGEMIERECELVIDRHLTPVLTLKLERYGPHPATRGTATAAPRLSA
jgi:hypothetical protein